ncbi:hypothetical protein NDU88_007681 [Pleurodeles waltl]|uniref:Uncharacterized protein n=1 Tax=Pleurodeles waltl TaxID=8319 RepID=A0AAV7N7L0_PLEWA|nr:hypothetical protein NDU88_007681 [Pleurodeles waltl]
MAHLYGSDRGLDCSRGHGRIHSDVCREQEQLTGAPRPAQLVEAVIRGGAKGQRLHGTGLMAPGLPATTTPGGVGETGRHFNAAWAHPLFPFSQTSLSTGVPQETCPAPEGTRGLHWHTQSAGGPVVLE